MLARISEIRVDARIIVSTIYISFRDIRDRSPRKGGHGGIERSIGRKFYKVPP